MVRDGSGYHSTHNEVSKARLIPEVPLSKNQAWEDWGIETSEQPIGRFKKPAKPKKGERPSRRLSTSSRSTPP